MDIEKLKQLTNERENMLWINTTGVGMAAADYLEAAGVKVNRFNSLEKPMEIDFEKLIDLAKSWEQQSKIRFQNAEHEKNDMGKRLIEHGAVCYFNCSEQLKSLV